MAHSTNQGLGRQSALTRRSFVAGASVLAAGMLLGGPFGCSAPAEEGAADTSIEAEAQATGKAADLVFKNGHVQTLVNEGDVAQAVAVRGGDIVYVGDDAGIEAFVGDATKVIDLGGKFLCPGFMDGHLHGPQPYYEELFQIAIPEGTMDNEEYLRIIREFVEAHPDDEVYYGGPFMQNAYLQPDGSNPGPQKEDLDAICSDKPIMIRDVSHHSYWVNSKALEIAGITADTPDPDGGSIVHNAAGQPSGLLTDAAKGLVWCTYAPSLPRTSNAARISKRSATCSSCGCTTTLCVNWKPHLSARSARSPCTRLRTCWKQAASSAAAATEP